MAEVLDTEVVRDRGASPGPRERSPRPRRVTGALVLQFWCRPWSAHAVFRLRAASGRPE
jgi:hypothetical protein